ncbi:MAG: hypothetical protein PHN74_00080 [Candidatus Pacebacteria bacterium]|nr:hypothetical protein [Candidatus Paceibacterota bacterium]
MKLENFKKFLNRNKWVFAVAVFLIAVAMLPLFNYSPSKDTFAKSVAPNYYQRIHDTCNDSCCEDSVKFIAENNYQLAENDGSCPTGQSYRLKCKTSYSWCKPN